jgi:hypothetical protein
MYWSRIDKSAFWDVEFEPAREADVVKIEVGAGRFFFDDVNGFGAFGEGRKKEREGVALTTVFEVGLAGVEFDVDGLDQGISGVGADGSDESLRMHLDPAAVDIIVGGRVVEVYAGIGLGEFNTGNAELGLLRRLHVEIAQAFELHLLGFALGALGWCFCFCVHVFLF